MGRTDRARLSVSLDLSTGPGTLVDGRNQAEVCFKEKLHLAFTFSIRWVSESPEVTPTYPWAVMFC